MKKTLSATMALLTFSILISGAVRAEEVPAPCLSLKDNIARKIIRNGVPAVDFTLNIVPKEEVGQVDGKVVGNCGYGSHRIMYIRGKNINPQGHQFGQGAASVTTESPVPSAAEESPAEENTPNTTIDITEQAEDTAPDLNSGDSQPQESNEGAIQSEDNANEVNIK